MRPLPPIHFSVVASLEDELEEWENQLLAWTWSYDPDRIRAACQEIRDTAGSRGWAIDERIRVPAVVRWWAFDLVA
jgi:hypothetical protein